MNALSLEKTPPQIWRGINAIAKSKRSLISFSVYVYHTLQNEILKELSKQHINKLTCWHTSWHVDIQVDMLTYKYKLSPVKLMFRLGKQTPFWYFAMNIETET